MGFWAEILTWEGLGRNSKVPKARLDGLGAAWDRGGVPGAAARTWAGGDAGAEAQGCCARTKQPDLNSSVRWQGLQ